MELNKYLIIPLLLTPLGFGCTTIKLDADGIQKTIESHKDELKECYQTRVPQSDTTEKKITLLLTLDAKGRVSRSRIQNPHPQNKELEDCMIERSKTWTFDTLPRGTTREIRYPFDFKSKKKASIKP